MEMGVMKYNQPCERVLHTSQKARGLCRCNPVRRTNLKRATFEVASIKANHSGNVIMLYQPWPGGRFTATNSSLSLLIQSAYGVEQFQISGAPGWVQSDKYDIAAEAAMGNQQAGEIRAMLRRLLEERFKLQYRWETKEAPVYALVVSKAGKLRESESGECPPDFPCRGLRNSPGHTYGSHLSSAELAGSLSLFVGRLVLDKTALTGKYDVDLQWTPERVRLQSAEPPADQNGPSIFTAIQEQLGLKLESAKGPVKTLTIGHVERPSEN